MNDDDMLLAHIVLLLWVFRKKAIIDEFKGLLINSNRYIPLLAFFGFASSVKIFLARAAKMHPLMFIL